MNAKSWSQFWGTDTTYACDKHKKIVEDQTLKQQLSFVSQNDVVLDFGCGESPKETLAEAVSELFLYGDAQEISNRLFSKYKGKKNINVVYGLDTSTSFSIIFVCSVIQYLSKEEFTERLKYFRSVMKPGGRLIISDVIPKNISGFKELLTLLSVAAKNNFLMDAILNLFRMMKGEYGSLRKSHDLTKYDKDEIFALLKEAGFSPKLHSNIGLNKDRYCVVSSINRKSL